MGKHLILRSVLCILLGVLILGSTAASAEESPSDFILSPFKKTDETALSQEAGTVSAMAITEGPITYSVPDDEVPILSVAAEGLKRAQKLPFDITPTSNAIRVIGYANFNTLPKDWGEIQDKINLFSGNLIDAFSNMDEKEYYFTMAMAMCSTMEPIDWANESALVKYFGDNEQNQTFAQILKGLEQIADIVELEETSKWLTGISEANKGIKSFCKIVNRLALLNSLDWDQAEALADTWIRYGNNEMKDVGQFLMDLKSKRRDGVVQYTALMSVSKYGMDTLMDEIVGISLKKVAGSAHMFYEAAVFAIDAYTRFSVLSGDFKDMECAARSMEACKTALKHALDTYKWNVEQALESDTGKSYTRLFTNVMYAGINYAQACGIMNETYSDYIKVGKNSLAGVSYLDPETLDLAVRALIESESFHAQAKQMRNQLKLYDATLKSTEKRVKALRSWEHHWRMQGHPRNTLDITRRWDGTLRVTVHFQGEKDFRYISIPYADQKDKVMYVGDSDSSFSGTLLLNDPESGQISAWWTCSGDPDPKSRTYPYILKARNESEPSVYTVADNPENGWARHWQMHGHPENTMDITRTGGSTFHLTAHFDGAGDYEYDFDLKENADQEGFAYAGESYKDMLHIQMWLDLETDGEMSVLLSYHDTIDEDNPLYPYITHDPQNLNYLDYLASDYRYELLPDGTAVITEYVGEETEVYVPAELDGYPVTRIGSRAFFNQKSIEQVWMNGVPITLIESEAFRGCEKLHFVQLSEPLKEIGYKAFDYCIGLTEIVLPDQIRAIGFQAFSFCKKLEEVYCPESLRYIDSEAFINCPKVWFYVYPDTHAEHWCCVHNYTWKGPVGEVRSRRTVQQEIDSATREGYENHDYSVIWAHRWVCETRPDLILDITPVGDGEMHAVLSRSGESILSFRMCQEWMDNIVSYIEADRPDDQYHFDLYLEPMKGYMAELYLDDQLTEKLFPGETSGFWYFYTDEGPDPLIYGFDRNWFPSDWDGHWRAEADGHTADLYIVTTTMTPEGTSARLVMDGKTTIDLSSVREIDPDWATFIFSEYVCEMELCTDHIDMQIAGPTIVHLDLTKNAKFRYMGPCEDGEAGASAK